MVGKVRRLAGTKRVGHLGTLDPIATGVLPLVIGRATRLAQFYTRSDKIYEGVVRFGWSTDSYDRAGEPTSTSRTSRSTARNWKPRWSNFAASSRRRRRRSRQRKSPAGGPMNWRARTSAVRADAGAACKFTSSTLLAGRAARRACACTVPGALTCARIAHDLGQALGCGAHLHGVAAGWPAANSKSPRRARLRNWKRWRPRSG